MTVQEAIDILEAEDVPAMLLRSKEARQTLKTAVLAQQSTNKQNTLCTLYSNCRNPNKTEFCVEIPYCFHN